MILVDTNVISELMRLRPEPGVLAWLDAQDLPSIWLCAINVLEVELGIELLDDSKRRLRLRQQWSQLLDQVFGNRVLPLDANAAARTALLLALKRKQGRTIELRDAMIAGIALHHRCALATRNVRHFDDSDVELINPWSS